MTYPLFCYESFAGLVREIISHGYSFLRVDESPGEERARSFYLRHDVDLSALAAMRIGEIEASLGVTASFFFLLGGDTYNLLSRDNLRIVHDLRLMGHCVGLHIDERLIEEREDKLQETVAWFNSCVEPIDNAVSFHRPTEQVLGKDFASFRSAYRPEIFSPEHYLSDSRRDPSFFPTLKEWIEQGRAPIQLLLHPGWWYPEQDPQKFKDDLLARRLQEADGYLKTNFAKVFESTKSAPERDFGL